MKLGDKVKIIKGYFEGKKAIVVKAFEARRLDNTGAIQLVALKLENGSNLILKQSSVR